MRFGYDEGGRRISEQGAEVERRFAWDPRGFLARVTTVALAHDRVQASHQQRLRVDAVGELAEVDGEQVFWDSASPLPVLAQVGTQSVVSYAGLTGVLPGPQALGGAGVPEVSAHGAGWMSPDWRPRSSGGDPWGVAGASLGASVSAQGGLLVAGMEWMQARVYDPASRAFLSTDPLDAVPGVGWSGNPYSFAGNDPLNFSDPLGLRPLTDADLAGYHQGGGLWGRLRGAASFVAGHVASAAESTWGTLSHAASSAWDWAKAHKDEIFIAATATAGIALACTGVGGPAAMVLLSASLDAGMQKVSTGSVDYKQVAVGTAMNMVVPGGGLARSGARVAETSAARVLSSDLARGGARNLMPEMAEASGAGARGLANRAGEVIPDVVKPGCFAADTQVLMGDGSSKSIQDVVVGDEVLAWNQATGENEPRRVVEAFVHEGVETWEVETADGQVVTSTAEHPFWVEDKGWTPVRELVAGDVLASADGPIELVRVEATGETARVFNVHVEGLHNYQVGSAGLRVHNNCTDVVLYDPLKAAQSKARALLGQETAVGWPTTPNGFTVSQHAAERIALGGGGRPPTTLQAVDEFLENVTSIKHQPERNAIRVKSDIRRGYVVVADEGRHIITVMFP